MRWPLLWRWCSVGWLGLCALHSAWALDLRAAYSRPPTEWPSAWLEEDIPWVELGPLPQRPAPDPALRQRQALGQALFFDQRLSSKGTVACADCHRPQEGWSTATPRAWGLDGRATRRHPPSLWNVALRQTWGWDGRHSSLKAAAIAPLSHPEEMGNPSVQAVEARLLQDPALATQVQALYGVEIRYGWIGDALGAFMASLHRPSRFDQFLRGDVNQLTPKALQGLHLFRTKARCIHCHHGPLLSDERFHHLGLVFPTGPAPDLGRHAVTDHCEDVGRFRTPSLRQVAQTAPYMHHGLFRSLRGVVEFYRRGGGDIRPRNAAEAAHPLWRCAARKAPALQPLHLTEEEVEALMAFLETL